MVTPIFVVAEGEESCKKRKLSEAEGEEKPSKAPRTETTASSQPAEPENQVPQPAPASQLDGEEEIDSEMVTK